MDYYKKEETFLILKFFQNLSLMSYNNSYIYLDHLLKKGSSKKAIG